MRRKKTVDDRLVLNISPILLLFIIVPIIFIHLFLVIFLFVLKFDRFYD